MLTRLRTDERGHALVPAMLIMVILLSFGIATAAAIDTDQADSRRERERESSFQLTEGVLTAQIYQLSTAWPSATSASTGATAYAGACSGTATGTGCPNAAAVAAQLEGVDYTDDTTWVTQVRDNGGASPNYWTDALLATQPSRDANDDNFLWVRAEGIVQGRRRTLVALVEAENVTVSFPHATLVAGHFATSNNGNKTIIDTNGESNQFTSGDIIVRCDLAAAGCADYEKAKGQVSPDTVQSNPTQPRAVSVDGLELLRERAKREGNYYSGCAPSLAGDQPGELVFMENATGCSDYNGEATYNTAAKPGYVVIARGVLPKINGNVTFHGIFYHANLDNSSGNLMELSGNVAVYGSVVIDGPGGLLAGQSKTNLVYDPNVFNGLKAFGTAGIVQNTFREITPGV
jgi:Tfp pilus assembly protein PilX